MSGSNVELITNKLQNIQTDKKTQGKIAEAGNRNSNDDINKVAKEMESLFIYELMKVMRETTDALSKDNKGLGNETYTGMFDMEVSRLMSEKGIGIKDSIVKWFERSSYNRENERA